MRNTLKDKIVFKALNVNDIALNFSIVQNFIPSDLKNKLTNSANFKKVLEEIGSYFLVRYYTDKARIKYNEYGKPYIDGELHFNVSHSDGIVVIALSDKEIGVDIERIRTVKNRVIKYSLSDKEYKGVDTVDDFFTYWTIKESVGKCIGVGLSKGIKNIPTGKTKTFMGKDLTSFSMKIGNYILSATYEGFEDKSFEISQVSILDLLGKTERDRALERFETERLVISELVRTDVETFENEFDNNPLTFIGYSALENTKENHQIFPPRTVTPYVIRNKINDKIVGYVGLTSGDTPLLEYFLMSDETHKGYMHEALNGLLKKGFENGIVSFHAFICEFNDRSIELVKKLGFEQRETLKEKRFHYLYQGDVHYIHFAIKKETYIN
ncbi:MAG: GNAT family N-acetyltransferase [Gammaproteobacteria bacterium]|nr:GNAT family N-acetyltransferase [Gammaproteobacteria bacterium]